MTERKKIARVAGLLYLIVVLTGIFSLAYIPKQLVVWDNPQMTFNNLIAHETLFRVSILSSVVCYIAFTFLPLVLYQLLKSVHKGYAQSMVFLAIISIPMSFLNLTHKYNIVDLIENQTHTPLATQDIPQQIMLSLAYYDNGILILTVFWGLWLFPFGYLVYKSNFLPKILGIFLMLGCLGYLINFSGNTLSPNYRTIGVSQYLSLLPAIGEIGTCLWLVFIGAKETNQN